MHETKKIEIMQNVENHNAECGIQQKQNAECRNRREIQNAKFQLIELYLKKKTKNFRNTKKQKTECGNRKCKNQNTETRNIKCRN